DGCQSADCAPRARGSRLVHGGGAAQLAWPSRCEHSLCSGMAQRIGRSEILTSRREWSAERRCDNFQAATDRLLPAEPGRGRAAFALAAEGRRHMDEPAFYRPSNSLCPLERSIEDCIAQIGARIARE